ncbi:DNA polymerase V [Camponotus floridanus]|uniref:DNA polymerase V n=1 Tax=Camponotus floridanus TaxID=104421 RepID=UPI00059DDAF0|nr:DNA polymerase V [Camponotus floridanus]
MNSIILDNFDKLKNNNDFVRLNAGVALLNHLCQYNTDQDDKELKYALNRLVRSLGSSQTLARKGNYTTLTVFLMMHPETSIEKLLSITNTQLHPIGKNTKSENADIYMGRILLCGAIIRSKLLVQSTIEIQQQITEILLNAGKQRSYLSFISVMFLNEFIIQLDIESMKKIVWPIVEKEIGKSWPEQTLDTFYLLLIVGDKHPSLVNHKFLKEHFGVKQIIAKESMENIVKLLTALPRIVSYQHPVFKLFCQKLTLTELITDFWKAIDQKFTKPSKSDEYIATEILQLILSNITDKTVIPSLLSPNFLQHILRRFSNCKRNNNDEVLTAFRKVLHLVISATNEDIKTKIQLNILKKLILHPGDLMIEKKTGIKVIQKITANLKLDGIKKLCQLYRDIIENKTIKERENVKVELWTNAERSYAAQLLTRLIGHREALLDQEWKFAQLTFLFNYGLCEVSNVGIELAPQFKNSFYRALDHKLPKLDDMRNLLSILVHDLNSKLQSNAMKLRSPLSDAASDAWRKALNLIEKLEKNTKNAVALPIFHTMNLHMSLQLFSDPEIAIMSIDELQCCYERLIKKSKGQKFADAQEEPQWVEVIVDLLLSLLSRNNHLLRSLVDSVFPHICPYLTPSAVHQILAVLDVKNNQSTLTTKQSDNEDFSDIESESDNEDEGVLNSEVSSKESESESNIIKDENDDNNDNEEEEEDDDDDDDDDDEDDNDNDDDETMTDKLRMAVRQALGDAATQTDDEDIDVDQINEEEGKRLDESLAAAFKILRENRQARSKKQEKTSEALTHFRIRVIDLLNIYLGSSPSMAVALDMIVPLFALLEFCIKDPHQQPLKHKVQTCLKKLSMIKKFEDTTGVDNTLLMTVLKALIEKGERSTLICQEISENLAECCTFLVKCMQQANLCSKNVVELYSKNLTMFMKKRDCTLSLILFKSVLQLCWEDNWQLALLLVNSAFDGNIRYFRRSQALELLITLYRNNRLLNMETKNADVKIKFETMLYKNTLNMCKELCNSHVSDNGQFISYNGNNIQKKVLQKFIGLLLTLLHAAHAHHLPQVWNWQNIKMILVTMYENQTIFSADLKNAYKKLAKQIGISLDVKSRKNNKNDNQLNGSTDIPLQSNGKQNNIMCQNGKSNDLEEEEEEETMHSDNVHKKKKKKNKQKEKQLLKKEARELRAKAMSKDIELFKFSNVNLSENDINETEIFQNGHSHDKSTNSKSLNKRNHGKAMEESHEPKKRRKSID